jgi:hypothetical protein
MSEPRRWLERNDLEAGDAVTQLLQAQRGFLPLDAAAAARVKHAVLHATGDVPGQALAQQGVLERVGAQLSRLGQHRFSASAVAATTVGAAALGAAALGGLLVLFGNPFAARSAPASDIASAALQAVNEPATRLGTMGSVQQPDVLGAVVKVRSARDPWAASLWYRAEGGVEVNLHCETAASFWGAFAGTAASPRFGNMYCSPDVLASTSGFALLAAEAVGGAGADEHTTAARVVGTPFADTRLSANTLSLNTVSSNTVSLNTVSSNTVSLDAASMDAASLTAAHLNAVAGGALDRSQKSLGLPTTNRRRPSGRPSGRSSGDPRGLREETLLLEAARSDLARNPRSALRTALEHQQQFPQGQLTLQRVLIQIEALLRLGQDGSAIHLAQGIQNSLFSSRAKDLLTRYGAAGSVKE